MFQQRMLRVVIFKKTNKQIRNIQFKICTDLTEKKFSHRLLKHVTINLLVCNLICWTGEPFQVEESLQLT